MDIKADEDKTIEVLQTLLQGDLDENAELHKAAKGNNNDEDDKKKEDNGSDDSYNPVYMKKHMKRFMKENKSSVSKYMKDIEGLNKAIVDELEVKVPEIEEADATIVDGTDMFKAFVEISNNFTKAIGDINERLESIEATVSNNGELSKASGQVLVKAATALDEFSKTPQPIKGVTNVQEVLGEGDNTPLQKAKQLGMSGIKNLLQKAALDGNINAAKALTQVECCFGNLQMIPPQSLSVIAEIASTNGGGN